MLKIFNCEEIYGDNILIAKFLGWFQENEDWYSYRDDKKYLMLPTLSGEFELSFHASWNNLMRLLHDIEPLACPICKKEMKLTGIIFFSLSNPSDKDILLNYEMQI